jgi:hypothetical protein
VLKYEFKLERCFLANLPKKVVPDEQPPCPAPSLPPGTPLKQHDMTDMSLMSPQLSISDLALEAHMEEMRDGDWVVMHDGTAATGSGDGGAAWANRFLTLNDHEDEARPRLEWVTPSSAKKHSAARVECTFRLLLQHVTEVQVGLPEDVSALLLFKQTLRFRRPPHQFFPFHFHYTLSLL